MLDHECIYRKPYLVSGYEQNEYVCHEIALGSGYCIFHDPNYFKANAPEAPEKAKTLLDRFRHLLEVKNSKGEELEFVGYNLPDLDLSNIVIHNNLNMVFSTFKGYLDLTSSTFEGKLNIGNSVFEKNLTMDYAKFLQATDFRECHFHGDVEASDITFEMSCIFTQAKFDKKASFAGAIFKGTTSFITSIFSGEALFYNTKFLEETEFNSTRFEKNTFFHGSFFENGWFDAVIFEQLVNFNTSEAKKLNFSNSHFDEATFHGLKCNNGRFQNSIFNKKVNFNESQIDRAYYQNSIYHDFATFENTSFSISDFNYSKFKGRTHFIETRFLDICYFNYCIFEKQNETIFQRSDLSNVSFLNTDITRVNFGEQIRFGSDKFAILDERRLLGQKIVTKNLKNYNVALEGVLAEYRNLRENYEYYLKYDDAGKFFIKEMELKRNYEEVNEQTAKKKDWIYRNLSPLGIYFHLNKYGENEIDPLKWIILLLAISFSFWYVVYPLDEESLIYTVRTIPFISEFVTPLINLSINTPSINSTIMTSEKVQDNFVERTKYSFEKTMSNIFQVNDESTWFDYIIRILLLIELGVFFIAIRRKLERRFRH